MLESLRRRVLAGLTVAVMLVGAPLASAVSFSAVFSFGDSLSDTGNISQATGGFPPAPYSPGRFTSLFTDGTAGSTWIEYVSANYGASSLHSARPNTHLLVSSSLSTAVRMSSSVISTAGRVRQMPP